MQSLVVGNKYNVTVSKFVKSGAVVLTESGDSYLIHVSRISSKFVSDPSHFLTVGNVYEALAVEGSVKPVELSLLHLELRDNTRRDSSIRPNTGYHMGGTTSKSNMNPHTRRDSSMHTTKSNKSLDDMISACNRSFEDKFGKGSLQKKDRSSRNNRRKSSISRS